MQPHPKCTLICLTLSSWVIAASSPSTSHLPLLSWYIAFSFCVYLPGHISNVCPSMQCLILRDLHHTPSFIQTYFNSSSGFGHSLAPTPFTPSAISFVTRLPSKFTYPSSHHHFGLVGHPCTVISSHPTYFLRIHQEPNLLNLAYRTTPHLHRFAYASRQFFSSGV